MLAGRWHLCKARLLCMQSSHTARGYSCNLLHGPLHASSVLADENTGMTEMEEGPASGIENLVEETDFKHTAMQIIM